MSALAALRTLADALPPGGGIVLTREQLQALLATEASPSDQTTNPFSVDLTIQQVADLFGRSPGTVRRWIEGRQLRAYKLVGREWRVPRSALEEFQQMCRAVPREEQGARVKVLGAWRNAG